MLVRAPVLWHTDGRYPGLILILIHCLHSVRAEVAGEEQEEEEEEEGL